MVTGGEEGLRLAALLFALLLGAAYSRIHLLGRRLQILLRLPATLLHESAHFIVALATGGRPTGFSLIPRCEESRTLFGRGRRRWVLGSVTIRNPGFLSTLPSGLAPLLLIPVSFYLYRRWFGWFPTEIRYSLILGILLFSCCAASAPSRTDVAVSVSRPMGLLFYGALLGGAVLFRENLLPLLHLFVS